MRLKGSDSRFSLAVAICQVEQEIRGLSIVSAIDFRFSKN